MKDDVRKITIMFYGAILRLTALLSNKPGMYEEGLRAPNLVDPPNPNNTIRNITLKH